MSREKLHFRISKGALTPADAYTLGRLRERGYKIGDVVSVTVSKLRSNGFNRLAHRLGKLCSLNLEGFEELDGHRALKRLQLESGIACDETAIKVPGLGMVLHRVPLSLSFDAMDEDQFREVIKGLCRYISKTYWPTLSAEQIEELASAMPEE